MHQRAAMGGSLRAGGCSLSPSSSRIRGPAIGPLHEAAITSHTIHRSRGRHEAIKPVDRVRVCMSSSMHDPLGNPVGKGSHDKLAMPQPSTIVLAGRLPNQAESVFNPTDTAESLISRVPVAEANTRSVSDLDYLTELLAIQQSDGPKSVGFFGTRNMGVTHQQLVEILSYAYASTGNHIYTSGSIGTNAAVIKGALRANCPDKLTVILPQSLKRQPGESQELLQQVTNLVEMPENDDLSLLEASRICNQKIISHVQQVICFAFHDSRLLLETCHQAKDLRKIVTLFYLD